MNFIKKSVIKNAFVLDTNSDLKYTINSNKSLQGILNECKSVKDITSIKNLSNAIDPNQFLYRDFNSLTGFDKAAKQELLAKTFKEMNVTSSLVIIDKSIERQVSKKEGSVVIAVKDIADLDAAIKEII